MQRPPHILALPFLTLALLGGAAAAHAGTLTVEIFNVRNAAGVVHIDACTEAQFLKDTCHFDASVPARSGTVVLTIHDIPDGTYAIQAFHDENRNGKVDRGLFGIPKEGIGFSNDAPIHFGPPSWKDAHVAVAGTMKIRIKMRYMTGAPGPVGN
jgi:uncharacterized protein (DUF2141 family)